MIFDSGQGKKDGSGKFVPEGFNEVPYKKKRINR